MLQLLGSLSIIMEENSASVEEAAYLDEDEFTLG